MSQLHLPWLELTVLVPLAGGLVVGRVRDVNRAARWAVRFAGAALALALGAAVDFYLTRPPGPAGYPWGLTLGGGRLFAVDELSAPLLPLVALLHFLTALATAKTKMRRFSFSASLFTNAIRMAVFGTTAPWLMIALLALGSVPPYFELRGRGAPTRVYALHMGLFVGLLALGWGVVRAAGGDPQAAAWGSALLLAAVLVRSGSVPVHCWLTDLFEHSTFGTGLLFVTPLTGVYLAVRLVLPTAPDWALQVLGAVSLFTAVYAAGMALVQRETRRFFAYLFLSHASLVLVGLELVSLQEHPALGLTGALSLWAAVSLALGGFGLVLRALEARYGRLSLADFHGLYDHSPTLAVCFLLTGLASVGFPGTMGYVAAELVVDGAMDASPWVGLGVVVAGALNGIAVVRAYFLLFTGARHASTVSLGITRKERFAVLTLAALLIGGGLVPQPWIASRSEAARAALATRGKATPASHTAQAEGEAERAAD